MNQTAQKPQTSAHRYGPWYCKQRAAGDWVVEQYNHSTMRARRYGPYPSEAEAREVLADLTEK